MQEIDHEAACIQLDREKLEADIRCREREIAIQEREIAVKERDHDHSRWSNPLVIAILGAGLAALSNAGVTLINGYQQQTLEDVRAAASRDLEDKKAQATLALEENKSEAARILEIIKTNDPEKAAVNLRFLMDTWLIFAEQRRAKIQEYLKYRPEGGGAALPAAQSSQVIVSDQHGIDRDLYTPLPRSSK